MLRKFLLLLFAATIATTVWAQIPEFIAPPRTGATPRTPLGCAEGNAGGTLRTLGTRNKNTTDIRYLCLGDTLFLNPNGQANFTNDSVPATRSGIGYFSISVPPRFQDLIMQPLQQMLAYFVLHRPIFWSPQEVFQVDGIRFLIRVFYNKPLIVGVP